MGEKKAERKQQKLVLKRKGLRPIFWAVVTDRETHMIVKNRITGEFKFIEK